MCVVCVVRRVPYDGFELVVREVDDAELFALAQPAREVVELIVGPVDFLERGEVAERHVIDHRQLVEAHVEYLQLGQIGQLVRQTRQLVLI